MNKTSRSSIASLATAAALAFPAAALAQQTELTFVVLSDIYEMSGDGTRGGFARAAAVAEAERSYRKNVLYVHAGDMLSPSLLSSIDKGKHTVDLLNFEPPDIFVPGNHEFDFGPDHFKRIILGQLNSDIMAANMRYPDGRHVPGLIDAKLYDYDGVKVGVFGLITPSTQFLSSPDGRYQFLPIIETARENAAALREQGADLVVAVAHIDRPEDFALIDDESVDVIISGSDHDLMLSYNGKVALVETTSDAHNMVAVDLTIETYESRGERRTRWWPRFRVIDTAQVVPHPDVLAKQQELEGFLDDALGAEIGVTSTELDSRRESVRGNENAFGNLIADSMRELVGADVAIANGGGIRANTQYPAGTRLARRDILKELPFGNSVVMIEVSGADLRAALENGFSAVEDGAGRFPHLSNIEVDVDLGAEPGSRIKSAKVGGRNLDDSATYTLATNDYLAGGGDAYGMFVGAKVLKADHDTDLVAHVVIKYIEDNSPVAPRIEGRINLMRP